MPVAAFGATSLTTRFADLRAAEFGRLDARGETYLDYTGSGLYPESLVRRHLSQLRSSVLGNPHSAHPASLRSTALLERARADVLRFIHADPAEYDVAFTANASAAIKLVGESFPFGPASRLVVSADNHNSVNGIREFARRAGATVTVLDLDADLRLTNVELARAAAPSLVAYPAQSNFSGVQHPLELIADAHAAGYRVLVDAAAFAPTNPLDLSRHGPDFLALSFYKMFGYPTGVGVLIAHREALAQLNRPWFAGGTVLYASVQNAVHRLLPGADAFQDGTPNFLMLPAVSHGLDFLARIGMRRIHRHVQELLGTLLERLQQLAHANGQRLVRIYGPETTENRGATVAFNVLDRGGHPVSFDIVEAGAAAERISVRGGCFCNPGASERAFGFEPRATQRCFDALGDAFTPQRLAACVGKPAGAVRVSLGMATNSQDIDRLMHFIAAFRDRYR